MVRSRDVARPQQLCAFTVLSETRRTFTPPAPIGLCDPVPSTECRQDAMARRRAMFITALPPKGRNEAATASSFGAVLRVTCRDMMAALLAQLHGTNQNIS